MASIAEVRLWGRTIAAVSLVDGETVVAFQYDPAFVDSAIQVAPFMMPLATRIYTFPALSQRSFHGLPGLLADSLPDKFGNALIDAWLATQGRSSGDFNAVERLNFPRFRGLNPVHRARVIYA